MGQGGGEDAQRENGLGIRTLKETLRLLHKHFSPTNDQFHSLEVLTKNGLFSLEWDLCRDLLEMNETAALLITHSYPLLGLVEKGPGGVPSLEGGE